MMSSCYESCAAYSAFCSLKKKRIRKRIYKTRDLAHADIFDYIAVFYNRARRESHPGSVSTEATEQTRNSNQLRLNFTALMTPVRKRNTSSSERQSDAVDHTSYLC